MTLYTIYSHMCYFAYSMGAGEEIVLPGLGNPMKNDKIMLVAILASILFFTVLYFVALFKYKRERLQEAYLTEQRISKKIHDEIASELYCTINHVETTQVISGSEREQLIEKLNSIYISTRDLSRENASIDTGTPFPHQLKTMVNEYRCSDTNVIIKDIDLVKWNNIDDIIKVTLYRVMQELMINMKKHSGASIIILEFIYSTKHLVVKYKDNGKGLPDCSYTKNGLANVENRMETIGGTAIFGNSTGQGLHLSLTFPANTPYV